MGIVILSALGIGSATLFGTLLGFPCRKLTHRFSDIVLAFAAGVMLAAAIVGLILPAITYTGNEGIWIAASGILAGAFCLSLADRLIPHIHHLLGWESEIQSDQSRIDRVLLFVAAMAIHNFPEGLAAGVSFGNSSRAAALLISGGIALQNIPEGLVTVTPMLAAGISAKRTFYCGLFTAILEVLGTLVGYWFVSIISDALPFALAFAGGTMLFVVSDEMIPETHDHGNERAATYSLLIGFCIMLMLDVILG